MQDRSSATNTPPLAHSELGASSYARWGKSAGGCPGSVKLCRGVPKYESAYAKEGTLAHEVAACLLTGQTDVIDLAELPADMMDAVATYQNHVEGIRKQKPSHEFIEQKFDLSHYHPGLFGTADYVAFVPNARTLHVVDYKHGAGVAVEAYRNLQMQYYGLGALRATKVKAEKVVLTVVQPRCYHRDGPVRSWETTPFALLDFVADLVSDAKATEDPKAGLNDGPHCRWCPAQALCPQQKARGISLAQTAFTTTAAYAPEELAKTLRYLPQLEGWIKSVREFAYREAECGRIPPGWKLVDKRATRKWNAEFSPRKHAAKLGLEESECYEEKMLSPAQIEKLLTKELKPLLEQYTLKESSGKNLVPTNDDRPEVQNLSTMFPTEENKA